MFLIYHPAQWYAYKHNGKWAWLLLRSRNFRDLVVQFETKEEAQKIINTLKVKEHCSIVERWWKISIPKPQRSCPERRRCR